MNKYLLIFLVLASTNASAALNKWVDVDGKVHYSDSPPPPDAKLLRTTPGTSNSKVDGGSAPSGEPPAAKTIVEREAEWKKAQQAKKEAEKKTAQQQADEEAKKNYCNGLQNNLRALREASRIVEYDAAGNRFYMDDKQRQQRVEKTQQDFSTHCQ